MDFEANFRDAGTWDVGAIQRALPALDDPIWLSDTSRQSSYSHHQRTHSLFVANFPIAWDGTGHPQTVVHDIDSPLGAATWPLIRQLEERLGGKSGRALYVILPAGAEIPGHKDFGRYLETVRRVHVPIFTNSQVLFSVNDEVINMQPGQCIEINNRREHWVSNRGDTPRVHLICDVIPAESPDGPRN